MHPARDGTKLLLSQFLIPRTCNSMVLHFRTTRLRTTFLIFRGTIQRITIVTVPIYLEAA